MFVKQSVGLVLCVGVVITLLVWFWPRQSATAQPLNINPTLLATQPASATQDQRTGSGLTSPALPAGAFVTGLEHLPQSLAGTQVDGELLIDEQKQLVVTRRLRDLFDYFLSTIGEEDLATIQQRVISYIRHRTPQPAQDQAIHLFGRYLGYKNAVTAVQEAGGKPLDQINPDDIEKQKAAEQNVRSRFFSPTEITAFFGDSDQFDRYQLTALRIQQNNSLTDTEKARQLAELNAQLPQSMQDDMKTTAQYQQLQNLTDAIEQRGGNSAELRAMRMQLVGAEATARLEALDQQRAAFATRVNSYLAQRRLILANTALGDAQRQQQIEALQQQGFTAQEQLRLSAFEQLGSATP